MGMQEDDIPTTRMEKITWLPPVPSVDALPVEGVREGTMCFVEGDHAEGEEEIWEFHQGSWRRIDEL